MVGGRRWSALLLVVTLSGCAAAENAQPATGVQAYAQRLLDAAVVPAAATPAHDLPGAGLAGPPEQPACDPLVDLHREWTVPGTPAEVLAYVSAHPGAGITVDGGGDDGGVAFVMDEPVDLTYQGMLLFEAVALGPDEVGLRADAEAVPPGSSCTRS